MEEKYGRASLESVWAQLYISLIKAVVLPEGVTAFTHFKLDLHEDQRNESHPIAIYEIDFVFALIPRGIEDIGRLIRAPLIIGGLGENLQKSFEEGLLPCVMAGENFWHGLLECPDTPVKLNDTFIIGIFGRSGLVDSPGGIRPECGMEKFERKRVGPRTPNAYGRSGVKLVS